MTAEECMKEMKTGEAARRSIPLQLQVSLPLMGRRGNTTAECWYYRLQTTSEGIQIWSPAIYALWDLNSMTILEKEMLHAQLLGEAGDILTPEHRAKEDSYLTGIDEDRADTAAKTAISREREDERIRQWLEAAPEVLRPWLAEAVAEHD